MIEVRQLKLECRVDRDHPNPNAARARLAALAERDLARALAQVFPPSADAETSLWLIRRLETDALLDLDFDDADLAPRWANEIAASIRRALDERNPNAIRFASQAHHVAAYLTAAAQSATGQWYFRAFDGLALLSDSAKIRTILLDYPSGPAALPLLSAAARTGIANRVSEADAGIILAHLADRDPGERSTALEQTGHAWRAIHAPLPNATNPRRWALRLVLEAAAQYSTAAASRLAVIAPALAHLLTLAPDDGLARAVAEADWRYIAARHGAEAAIRLQPLRHLDVAPWFGMSASTPAAPDLRDTSHGGAFLLLPLLANAGSPAAPQAPWLRLMLLSCALGSDIADSVWHDALLRELCGLSPLEDESGFRAWLAAAPLAVFETWLSQAHTELHREGMPLDASHLYFATPAGLSAPEPVATLIRLLACLLLRGFAWRIPGFAQASPFHLAMNLLRFPAALELQETRRLVRFGYPPLGLLLNLTGLNRQRYALPWLAGPPIETFPEA